MSKDWDEKIFIRAPDLWSEAESEAERACSRRVGLSVHTAVLKWNECEPWSLRQQDSLRDFLNKTLQCSFSPMISVYMWTTGHQQLLLTSHEERLQMYLRIIDSVHFKTFSVAFVCRRKYMTSSALTLISKVFSEMYWNMTNKDVFVKNITVVVWKTIFCSISYLLFLWIFWIRWFVQ